ncbi:MAG: acyl carrier protein [Clostridia bacterium]|nr:acyl carrier protein [Clostridia bacterium]
MVFEKVKNILAAQFDVDEDSITMETDILEDLGADSLDVMDLMMTLGDEFDMQVDESEIENITTVGALVNFIEANS